MGANIDKHATFRQEIAEQPAFNNLKPGSMKFSEYEPLEPIVLEQCHGHLQVECRVISRALFQREIKVSALK